MPAEQLRAFVREIAGDVPHVIFHPGWMTARHKQSFYVSRTALILNALMGNIEIPGGCVLGKPPEHYGRQGLKHLTDRVAEVDEPRVDGAGTDRPQWDPAIGMVHQLFAAMETGQPYGIGAYFAYRHDPLTGMPDPDATKRALDKLKLLVSIDVRYSETGWFSDVILPEASYLERANILCQMNGPVPVFAMRDQVMAPRFDSRPAWWIFREILRRMDIKEALDFDTIEELWNYQLDGTGVTIADMREPRGSSAWRPRPTLNPRAELSVPDPVGNDRDRERRPGTGGAAQPGALRAQGGTDGRPLQSVVREDGDARARPVSQQPDPQRDRAGAGAVDPPYPGRDHSASPTATRWRSTGAAVTRAASRPR